MGVDGSLEMAPAGAADVRAVSARQVKQASLATLSDVAGNAVRVSNSLDPQHSSTGGASSTTTTSGGGGGGVSGDSPKTSRSTAGDSPSGSSPEPSFVIHETPSRSHFVLQMPIPQEDVNVSNHVGTSNNTDDRSDEGSFHHHVLTAEEREAAITAAIAHAVDKRRRKEEKRHAKAEEKIAQQVRARLSTESRGSWSLGSVASTIKDGVQNAAGKVLRLLTYGTKVDIHEVVEEDPIIAAIHANAEVFSPKVEFAFSYLQVGQVT